MLAGQSYLLIPTIIINSFLLFLGYILIFWLVEIVADSNAIKMMGKKIVIKNIGKVYENKKFNLENDWIMHPPWRIRKKIMENLD